MRTWRLASRSAFRLITLASLSAKVTCACAAFDWARALVAADDADDTPDLLDICDRESGVRKGFCVSVASWWSSGSSRSAAPCACSAASTSNLSTCSDILVGYLRKFELAALMSFYYAALVLRLR